METKSDIQKLSEQFRYKAQRFNTLAKRCIYFGIFLSLLAIVTKKLFPDLNDLDWILVALSFMVQSLAQWLNICSRKAHYRSRDGYRWFLISHSLEDKATKEDEPFIDLNQKLTIAGYPNVSPTDTMPYFQWADAKGLCCFVYNLHESVFHTKMIMKKNHNRKIVSVIIMITAIIIIMTAALTLTIRNAIDPYLLTLAVISVLIPLVSELLDTLKAQDPIHELERIQLYLEKLFKETEEGIQEHLSIILYTVGQYYAITASQDILNSSLYRKVKASLSQKYLELTMKLKK